MCLITASGLIYIVAKIYLICMRQNVEVIMQMLTLEEWASERYRSRPPRLGTLQRYARSGLFYPPAQKKVVFGA